MPAAGFQAVVLCGPGESLHPFNVNPKEFPKALIPIANRPMLWYPLEWCYRVGITNIHLITPPECSAAISAALAQNPHLTSLPSPKPTLVAPESLNLTTGTAELFRLPEVQSIITGDFVVLPCDLVCELSGNALLEAWMAMQGSFGNDDLPFSSSRAMPSRRGGLGVYYETKRIDEGAVGMKKEETDFLVTTDASQLKYTPTARITSTQSRIRNVALTMPTDTLKDQFVEEGNFALREKLMHKYGRTRFHVSLRDAHIYFLPYWVKEFLKNNELFESLGEDAIGSWSKAGWRDTFADKLGITHALRSSQRRKSQIERIGSDSARDEVDVAALSSTLPSSLDLSEGPGANEFHAVQFASRVIARDPKTGINEREAKKRVVPPFLGYIHPAHAVPAPREGQDGSKQKQGRKKPQQQTLSSSSGASGAFQGPDEEKLKHLIPLVRRVDTTPLLLSCSLYLARLPSLLAQEPHANNWSSATSLLVQQHQVHPSVELPSPSTIHTQTTLIDANVILQPRITIRDSVIGASCSIASGSRIHGCLLMEGVIIEEKVVLQGCVIGRRSRIEKGSELRDCWVQENYAVSQGSSIKGEVLAGFAGDTEQFEDVDMLEDNNAADDVEFE